MQVAVSPLAGVEAALARAAEVNPVVNALCLVDAESARARARELEARLERGEDTGPLTGWTFTVKDAMRQAGYPCTAGSRSLMGEVPDASTACVARLEAAGAIAIGRSNVPEFCYRGTTRNELYGQTGNPFAPDRSAGGSSGGAASALALGVGDLALGSDGGGSIRIPASFCGTVGLKPTYGLVPRAPDSAGWLLLTHFGPLTRSVADCARALAVMAGPDPLDPLCLPELGQDYEAAARDPGDLSGLRVAYSDDLGYIRLDREVRERFAEAVAAFAQATGATVEQAHPGLASPLEVWNDIACGDNSASEGPLLASGLVGDDARALIEAGQGLSAEAYVEARNRAHEIAGAWAAFHARYDLLLTPTMECVAFPLADWAPRELDGAADRRVLRRLLPLLLPVQPHRAARHQRADGAGLGRPAARAADRRPALRGRPRAASGCRLGARAAVGDAVARARLPPRPLPRRAAAAAAGRRAGRDDRRRGGLVARRAGARRRAVRARGRPAPARRARLEPPSGRAGGLLPGRGMSSDPGATSAARAGPSCVAARCADGA